MGLIRTTCLKRCDALTFAIREAVWLIPTVYTGRKQPKACYSVLYPLTLAAGRWTVGTFAVARPGGRYRRGHGD